MAETEAESTPEASETQDPERAEDGTHLYEGAPLNARLRAEYFARAGKDEDPHGLVTPDLIADAAKRLAAEEAAKPSMDWTKAQLEAEAERAGVQVPDNATKADLVDALQADPGQNQEA